VQRFHPRIRLSAPGVWKGPPKATCIAVFSAAPATCRSDATVPFGLPDAKSSALPGGLDARTWRGARARARHPQPPTASCARELRSQSEGSSIRGAQAGDGEADRSWRSGRSICSRKSRWGRAGRHGSDAGGCDPARHGCGHVRARSRHAGASA
jgi:hypothetical protein